FKTAECGVGPERISGDFHRLLLARRISSQRMLNAIAKLGQDRLWYIEWILRDEIDANALGTDQANHLLDTLQKRFGRFIEQKMCFIEKENEPRAIRIPHLGKFFEQFRQEPQQKSPIEPGLHHELVCSQDIHIAAP